ncbi:MAG: Wzz/FepE/Etk N-terminal domain-containing protein [Steroidobacteraceae bacterium]
MNKNTHDREEDGAIDLQWMFVLLWQKRWWVVVSVIAFLALFTTAAFTITPTYRAETVLISASAERSSNGLLGSALSQLGGLASLAGITVGSSDSETEESLAVLRSRQFTERFISENNLMPKLYAQIWDAAAGKWTVPDEERPTLAKASGYFNRRIRTIAQDKKTGLVILQIDWKDRLDAAAWANELVRRLNMEMRDRAIAKADASIGYLEKELNTTSLVGTQEAINRLIEAQIKQRMLANVSQEYSFRVVDKALPADSDDPVKPKKLYLIASGPFVGFVFGATVIFLVGLLRRWK